MALTTGNCKPTKSWEMLWDLCTSHISWYITLKLMCEVVGNRQLERTIPGNSASWPLSQLSTTMVNVLSATSQHLPCLKHTHRQGFLTALLWYHKTALGKHNRDFFPHPQKKETGLLRAFSFPYRYTGDSKLKAHSSASLCRVESTTHSACQAHQPIGLRDSQEHM